jgi:hypothetical protein
MRARLNMLNAKPPCNQRTLEGHDWFIPARNCLQVVQRQGRWSSLLSTQGGLHDAAAERCRVLAAPG